MEDAERLRRLASIRKRLLSGAGVLKPGYFECCPVCGQFFDLRDFTEVYYHADRPHPPMKADA